MSYQITGSVVEAESGRGVAGAIVAAFDRDRFFDDPLGETLTDRSGQFRIVYDRSQFRGLLEGEPDLYVRVRSPDGAELASTRDSTRFEASAEEVFRCAIPAAALARVGLSARSEPVVVIDRETLTSFTCLEPALDDDLVQQIRADVEGKSSLLEVFKQYSAQLRGGFDNDALPFRKMARLFELGHVPDALQGHYYGVAPGLRTGDLKGVAAEIGNVMGWLWGMAVAERAPWVGKSFEPMLGEARRAVVGASVPAETNVSRGINHFNVLPGSPVNAGFNAVLQLIWHLSDVPGYERLQYGHEKNGGNFAAHRARSIYPGTPREVYRLNYRYSGLGNPWPLHWLIDEVVEVGRGLYLGQVLFATDHLFETYDPEAPHDRYRYQHFGYFLLFREWWHAEARRLFPHLEISDRSARVRVEGGAGPDPRLSTLTLDEHGDGNVDPNRLQEVRRDLARSAGVLELLKGYSEALRDELVTDAPEFEKLQALFNAGIAPTTMDGFYRGALISWQSQGLLALAKLNSISLVWQGLRWFSPWTGKRFDPIEPARLRELTNGYETGDVPTFFCANTVVYRTARERLIRGLAHLADVWQEEATPEERRKYGYDAKTFFFIGKKAPSVYRKNRGKTVFQFNYRWKPLRNPLPDSTCIDEIVQIADGLYLGQLFYSTDWSIAYDPRRPSEDYKYDLFAYFLLMDGAWHTRRLKIGFDLDNV